MLEVAVDEGLIFPSFITLSITLLEKKLQVSFPYGLYKNPLTATIPTNRVVITARPRNSPLNSLIKTS